MGAYTCLLIPTSGPLINHNKWWFSIFFLTWASSKTNHDWRFESWLGIIFSELCGQILPKVPGFEPTARDGPWPDPTQAYFWPAVNGRADPPLTRVLFNPITQRYFFLTRGKNLTFLGNLNPNHKWLTRPDPGQKFLTQTHHYPRPKCHDH